MSGLKQNSNLIGKQMWSYFNCVLSTRGEVEVKSFLYESYGVGLTDSVG